MSMGALDAFSKAFSLVVENKGVYLLILSALLVVSVVQLIFPVNHPSSVARTHVLGNVIFENYGAVSEKDFINSLEISFTKLLVFVIVLSFVEYTAVKAYWLSVLGENYSPNSLFGEALPRIPGVVLVNLLAYLVSILLAIVPLGLILLGALTMSPFILLLGVAMFFALIPVVLTYYSLVVPAYIETGNVGAAIEALGLTFRHLLSALGYGLLAVLFGFTLSLLMAPFVLPLSISGVNPLVIMLLEAPFKAFFVAFLWAGGTFLYLELRGFIRKGEELLY
ncbi:hypothetical protein [Thermococcus sp.]|uniref:hypothetical protein n=1 Tax=Thermococcus sp. TaxID=35749 RepID=UPI0025D994EB|nr:hypothetical protein [Thermococcus sp.]